MDAIDPLSFDYSWPGLLEIFEALSQVMVLLGQSLSSNSLTVINELNPLETELGLVRNKLGTYQILIDVLLRSAWEDIFFLHQLLQDVVLRTLPLLKKMILL